MSDPQPTYLIEKIVPAGKIHLLAGISSAGKSRWLLPSLILWQTGAPILGLASYPVPWCLVCGDRPLEDAQATIHTMGFRPSDVSIIPAFGKHSKAKVYIIEDIIKAKARLVFWEGFDMLVKNPNNPYEVKELINTLTAYCQDTGITIIGSVGVPKLKPSESYHNPRQLVGGSTVWERTTSTNFVIQPLNPKNIGDGSRMLFCCLKNAPSFAVQGRFDHNGTLVFDSWDHKLEDEELHKLLSEAKHRRKPEESQNPPLSE